VHPALSVIVFTVASGAGYGLLALTGLGFALGIVPTGTAFAATALGLAFVLVTGGLLASTAHLGRPERAWRALTQVGSSWLSREGVASLATYAPFAAFAYGWIAAVASAALAAVTVWCTAMIYRSLRPIHQWCNPHVVPVYLALALMSGALWLDALTRWFGQPHRGIGLVAALAVVVAAALKERYWRFVDSTRSAASAGSATGLGRFGEVRLLDPPHTGSSYLLDEMGFRLARKHAVRLRRIALAAGFALPLALTLLALAFPALGAVASTLAALAALAGLLVERWLFFAEAKHTVTLYYGAATA
jgi:DMSO reductase anchor subunit